MATGYLVHSNKSSKPEAKECAITVSCASNEEQEFPIQIDCLNDAYQEDNRQIHLLPLLGGRTGSSSSSSSAKGITGRRSVEMGIRPDEQDMIDEFMIEGIVLRATSFTKGEFYRIGSFNIYKDGMWTTAKDEDNQAYENFLQILEEHGPSTAEAACAEIISNPQYPDQRYVVTLI